jgi:hypothetical protein
MMLPVEWNPHEAARQNQELSTETHNPTPPILMFYDAYKQEETSSELAEWQGNQLTMQK